VADAIPVPSPALDTKTLLARVDHRLALLRGWLSHHHGDEPYWWARRMTAPDAQRERHALRGVANLLHVERATRRGRIHGTRFPTLDDQRAWLADREARLGSLHAGELPI
jgi:hypothetical protein